MRKSAFRSLNARRLESGETPFATSRNAAAGSQGIGFWYALPEQPTGPSAGSADRPRRTPS